jgi:hypothetical protein
VYFTPHAPHHRISIPSTSEKLMQIYRRVSWVVACAAFAALVGSCSGSDAGPDGSSRALGPNSTNNVPSLLECPTNTTLQTQATVGLLGGVVQLGGTVVSIPVGALLEPTTIVVTIPASRYMEIDVSVPGTTSFLFQQPIAVTIDYSRCQRNNISLAPLQVWHIDLTTNTLLEEMPSIDSKLTQTITFTTGHLSGYALAN